MPANSDAPQDRIEFLTPPNKSIGTKFKRHSPVANKSLSARLSESSRWRIRSECALRPHPFHSMMVGGCTRGEGQLFLVRLWH
ncbi:hypothetical protein PhaeoP54_02253 [Phaeobacter inhibens]|nr:hypothetical protein PhaeoP54_02253 [Phaeobacter inhibens]